MVFTTVNQKIWTHYKLFMHYKTCTKPSLIPYSFERTLSQQFYFEIEDLMTVGKHEPLQIIGIQGLAL
jgi:hypothetical protein